MNYREGLEGISVTGTDIYEQEIKIGSILEVGKGFGVATIQTGNDRTHRTVAFLNNIEERIEDK